MATVGGRSLFLGTAAGSDTLAATITAAQPQAITLAANQGAGAALALVGAGKVRGAAWLDGNGDGLRQLWESPLAGIPVTVAGQMEVTDGNGRFAFYGVAPGTYEVTAVLPNGLTAQIGPVVVGEGRGAVVGVTAVESIIFHIYLPVILKP